MCYDTAVVCWGRLSPPR